VAEHYATLGVDELIDSVLAHYERLWPRIEELVAEHATSGPGLVLEGSALWPERVATLDVPRTAAVWLTVGEDVVRARIRAGGRYDEASVGERALMDTFLARSVRYQELMVEAVDRLGLPRVDVEDGMSVPDVADAVLAQAS
jgi:hypothetical protein